MAKNRCKEKTKKGKRCKKTAVAGSLFCEIHGGGGKGEKNKKPNDGSGPSGFAKQAGSFVGGAIVRDVLYKIWEWLKENGDMFLTVAQLALLAKLSKQKNESKKLEVLTKLVSSFSPTQWVQLMSVLNSTQKNKEKA